MYTCLGLDSLHGGKSLAIRLGFCRLGFCRYVCMCMCVCVSIIYVCLCKYIYMLFRVSIFACVYVGTYILTCADSSKNNSTLSNSSFNLYTKTYIRTYVHTYVHANRCQQDRCDFIKRSVGLMNIHTHIHTYIQMPARSLRFHQAQCWSSPLQVFKRSRPRRYDTYMHTYVHVRMHTCICTSTLDQLKRATWEVFSKYSRAWSRT